MSNKINNSVLYSDFDINFKPDSETGDIGKLENRDSIRNSLFRIISLNKMDIPFNTTTFSNLKQLLFETPAHTIDVSIVTNLTWLCEELEPRVRVDKIDVNYDDLENTYTIDMKYTILRTNTKDVLKKEIERVR